MQGATAKNEKILKNCYIFMEKNPGSKFICSKSARKDLQFYISTKCDENHIKMYQS